MDLDQFFNANPGVLTLLLIWSLIFKATALWQSANRRQLSWFLIILIVNTLGLLEIAYLVYLHRFNLGSQRLLKWLPWGKKHTPKIK